MSNIDYQTRFPAPGGVFTDAVMRLITADHEHTIPQKEVLVNQSNIDTTLGTTIDSTVLYKIDGDLDFTGYSIEVPSTGLFIGGWNIDLSFMRCADNNYTMFTGATAGNIFLFKFNYCS